jgi:hypothetical protein
MGGAERLALLATGALMLVLILWAALLAALIVADICGGGE